MIKKTRLMIVYPFILLLLQQAILNYTVGFFHMVVNYFDEAYIILLWFLALVKNDAKIYLDREDKKILLFSILFVALGLISNLSNAYQSFEYAMSDAFICTKFSLAYLGIRQYVRTRRENEDIILSLYNFSKCFILICVILTVINIVLPIFPTGEFRYFTKTVYLFFPHPSYLAIALITAVCAIIAKQSIYQDNKDMFYIVLGLVGTCFTVRSKAIAGVLCIAFIYLYFVKFHIKNKPIAAASALAIGFVTGYEQIAFYFGGRSKYDFNFVRERLLLDSGKIANRFFPLGSGFGTFASNIAAEHWSSLYSEYNYIYSSFLSDSFWPIVVAQTGWIGFGVFIFIIITYILRILKFQKVNDYLFWAGLSIMCYEIICSIAESAFFNPAVCPLFLLMGLINNQGEVLKNESLND